MKGKAILFLVGFLLLAMALAACSPTDMTIQKEKEQQGKGTLAIVENQPVPDLGGWSFERHVVIQTYLARNRTIATYTYMITLDGKIVEICPSIGYPIPYSTQLTNPLQKVSGSEVVIAQAEPTGLYPPSNADATLVQCANKDGTVSPTYFEPLVFALPYRIEADIKLARVDEKSSFSVNTSGK